MKLSLWVAHQGPDRQDDMGALWQRALRRQLPSATITVVDVLARWGHPLGRTLLREGLTSLQQAFPGWWGRRYHAQAEASGPSRPLPWWMVLDRDQAQVDLQADDPDLVIAFHPLAQHLAQDLRADTLRHDPQASVPVLAWLPLFHVAAPWWAPGLSRYAVPHPALLPRWRERGVPSASLLPLPFPLEPPTRSPAEARDALGLASPPSDPVILVQADRFSSSDLSLWLQQCGLLSRSFVWWLYVGAFDDLAEHAREQASRWGVQVQLIRDRKALPQLRAAADAVLLREQPLSVVEALAARRPAILWTPHPGPERLDASFLSEHGLVDVLDDETLLEEALLHALERSSQPAWRDALEQLLPPRAEQIVGEAIAELLDQHDALLHADAAWLLQREADDDEAAPDTTKLLSPEDAATPDSSGIFETIGARDPDPRASSLAPEDWKETLAHLLLQEKELQRNAADHDAQIRLWQERHTLAQEQGNDTLAQEARRRLEQAQERRQLWQRQWQTLQRRKTNHLARKPSREDVSSTQDSSPAPASAPASQETSTRPVTHADHTPPSDEALEQQFHELTLEKELAQLKQRMRIDRSSLDLSQLKEE